MLALREEVSTFSSLLRRQLAWLSCEQFDKRNIKNKSENQNQTISPLSTGRKINPPLCILIGPRSVSNIKSSVRPSTTLPTLLLFWKSIWGLWKLSRSDESDKDCVRDRRPVVVWTPLRYLSNNNYARQLLHKLPSVLPAEEKLKIILEEKYFFDHKYYISSTWQK